MIEQDIIQNLIIGILNVFSLIASLCLIPEFISGICGLRYCLGKNKGKLTACWIWGIISLFVNFRFIYIMNEEVDFGDIIPIYLFLIFNLPNILYLIGCYKAQFKNKV